MKPPTPPTAWYSSPYLLLPAAALFWAGNATAGKLAAGEISPYALTFARWLFALVIIYTVARPHLRQDLPTIRRYWKRLLALGACGFTGFNLALYGALNYTSAINVTIEQSALPALVVLINLVWLGQRIRTYQSIGVLLSICGVVTVATHGAPLTLLDAGLNRGDAIMLIALACYAGYTAALRLRPPMHALSLLFALAVAALCAALPFYAIEVVQQGLRMPSATAWGVIAYVCVFPSLLSQLFYIRGVEALGANRAGMFINLVPVFGSLVAVLVLDEHFQGFHLAGLVMVIGGIGLAERAGRVG